MNTHGHTVEGWRKICRAREKKQRLLHPETVRAKERRGYYRNRDKKLAASAVWRAKNREQLLASKRAAYWRDKAKVQQYLRKYYRKNQEAIKARSAKWYGDNRERAAQRTKQYMESLPAEIRKQRAAKTLPHRRAYRQQHAARYAAYATKRRALKMMVSVKPERIAEWMAEMRQRPSVPCYYCAKKLSGSQIHFDHVIPLSGGGAHEISNLAASCCSCNTSKSDNLLGVWNVKSAQQVLPL